MLRITVVLNERLTEILCDRQLFLISGCQKDVIWIEASW
jgi:hypothetical protein